MCREHYYFFTTRIARTEQFRIQMLICYKIYFNDTISYQHISRPIWSIHLHIQYKYFKAYLKYTIAYLNISRPSDLQSSHWWRCWPDIVQRNNRCPAKPKRFRSDWELERIIFEQYQFTMQKHHKWLKVNLNNWKIIIFEQYQFTMPKVSTFQLKAEQLWQKS